ncbi:MAG: 5,10-methenyltetrahydromethanopterin hydrogenase cofactor biosynthesis protein HmdB [Methanobacteriaceae archaeon]|nr:5,10-methenyltetrahydromethanopterin hydrogenase cofactor biosynthesis protein HmdB [Methanobacteriaceae archaeon]MDP3035550.1 5,10-methenyltetrahydromethanopterin hydrogenase cofactor biosynthesis protein HmdB [Methanobacteriaceae archaeon]MDP3485767.1 5,10-methenyltetrahydromethanopterin hydrogenase cofactor biosynthesis protein HmdB [Methanobacteriaceae archaeon]
MIEKILNKSLEGKNLQKEELLKLFNVTSPEEIQIIMDTAATIRDQKSKKIKLTSTVHLTNVCQVTPKCKYCGFAARTSSEGYYHPFYKQEDEILKAALSVEDSGIPRISCSGAHGYHGQQAVTAAKVVKENTSLELLVNVGSDLNTESLNELSHYETDTVCCNLETVNESIFNELKPGEKLKDRIKICEMVSELDLELSSGLLIGLGESYEDRVNHLFFLKKFSSLGEIPIMGFNPYQDTPMASHPPCSLEEQMKTIAITRIMYHDIRITVPTPTIGPENVKYSLMAGADNLATVIPDHYPSHVKGVGSPAYGNLKEVVKVVESMGLKIEYRNASK